MTVWESGSMVENKPEDVIGRLTETVGGPTGDEIKGERSVSVENFDVQTNTVSVVRV